MWLRIGTGRTLGKISMILLRGIPWLAKELVVYQERLCSKHLAGWLFPTSQFTIKSFRIFCCNLHFIFKHFAVAAASRNMASDVRDVSMEMTILFVATQALYQTLFHLLLEVRFDKT